MIDPNLKPLCDQMHGEMERYRLLEPDGETMTEFFFGAPRINADGHIHQDWDTETGSKAKGAVERKEIIPFVRVIRMLAT